MSSSVSGAVAALIVMLTAWVGSLTATAQTSKGDRALGEYLSNECVTCHQVSGRYDGIPPIVGWPDESFIEIMNEYRLKKRPHAVMQTIAGRLSDEEVEALAAYFGKVKPTSQ